MLLNSFSRQPENKCFQRFLLITSAAAEVARATMLVIVPVGSSGIGVMAVMLEVEEDVVTTEASDVLVTVEVMVTIEIAVVAVTVSSCTVPITIDA